ncbi:hypothetical protein F4818DRAFT_238925 [Hypoxylon cercidicola]|nr:hypothetical protein F4818DRAFT_238925 [Hypoxylon cercidicola]
MCNPTQLLRYVCLAPLAFLALVVSRWTLYAIEVVRSSPIHFILGPVYLRRRPLIRRLRPEKYRDHVFLACFIPSVPNSHMSLCPSSSNSRKTTSTVDRGYHLHVGRRISTEQWSRE